MMDSLKFVENSCRLPKTQPVRPSPKIKGSPPNNHLFSDYVSFGECKKMFSRMALFCFQICFFAASLQLPQCYWGYSNIFTSSLELRQLCVLEVRIRLMMLLSIFLFICFLLIVSLLGWGNALNKPGQLHNHHVILLETEEHLLFFWICLYKACSCHNIRSGSIPNYHSLFQYGCSDNL